MCLLRIGHPKAPDEAWLLEAWKVLAQESTRNGSMIDFVQIHFSPSPTFSQVFQSTIP